MSDPKLLHEDDTLNPWQPERDPIRLAALGKLAEELAEASAIVARCIIQGVYECEPVTGKQNCLALQNELADVAAAADKIIELFDMKKWDMADRSARKHAHFSAWHYLLLKPQTPPPADKPSIELRRRDTPENRAFWDSVRQAADAWERLRPEWAR